MKPWSMPWEHTVQLQALPTVSDSQASTEALLAVPYSLDINARVHLAQQPGLRKRNVSGARSGTHGNTGFVMRHNQAFQVHVEKRGSSNWLN